MGVCVFTMVPRAAGSSDNPHLQAVGVLLSLLFDSKRLGYQAQRSNSHLLLRCCASKLAAPDFQATDVTSSLIRG